MESDFNLKNEYSHKFVISQQNVELFAKATGDNNPIHLDNDYAKTTIFKTRIVHGFLGASVFSKVFGTIFPGEGTIYLSQSMKFLKPIYTERNYTAKFAVLEVIKNKNRARVETVIHDDTDTTVLIGEALIQNPSIK